MLESASVYLVDADTDSRRLMARRLAECGVEAWPLLGAAELLDLLGRLRPSVLILSLGSPARDGLDLLASLTQRGVDWPAIAYGADAEVATAVAAMRLGAIDFLEAPPHPRRLANALAAARLHLERHTMVRALVEEARERLARLTPRERDVASALMRGDSNKKVAHALGISVRTVEMHRAHLIAKLKVCNIAEAAVLLARADLPEATKEPACRSSFTKSASPTSVVRSTAGTLP